MKKSFLKAARELKDLTHPRAKTRVCLDYLHSLLKGRRGFGLLKQEVRGINKNNLGNGSSWSKKTTPKKIASFTIQNSRDKILKTMSE